MAISPTVSQYLAGGAPGVRSRPGYATYLDERPCRNRIRSCSTIH